MATQLHSLWWETVGDGGRWWGRGTNNLDQTCFERVRPSEHNFLIDFSDHNYRLLTQPWLTSPDASAKISWFESLENRDLFHLPWDA